MFENNLWVPSRIKSKILFFLVMKSSKNDLFTFYIRSFQLWLIFLLTYLFDRFLNWFIKKWNKSSKLYLSFSLPFLPWNFHITMILWQLSNKNNFIIANIHLNVPLLFLLYLQFRIWIGWLTRNKLFGSDSFLQLIFFGLLHISRMILIQCMLARS